ncbi:MAG: metalloregulator ArsR/SmtB family transcription factor [Hyphomicrobiaceae bacterium]
MDQSIAIDCLSALSQPTRLSAFRLLVAREPGGIPAGEIARLLAVPQNTMSSHLSALAACGLVRRTRLSRQIVYRADLGRFRAVLVFLLQDCCDGRPEICAPILDEIAPCCPPALASKEKPCA